MSKFSELDIDRQNAATEGFPIIAATREKPARAKNLDRLADGNWITQGYPANSREPDRESWRRVNTFFRVDGTAKINLFYPDGSAVFEATSAAEWCEAAHTPRQRIIDAGGSQRWPVPPASMSLIPARAVTGDHPDPGRADGDSAARRGAA